MNKSSFSTELFIDFENYFRVESACIASEQALSLNPSGIYVLTNAASLNIQLGQVKTALGQLTKAFNIANTEQQSLLWKVHQTWGDLFLSCGRIENARESYPIAYDQIPGEGYEDDQVDTAIQLAETKFRMNQLEEAWIEYSRLLELILQCDPEQIRLVKIYTRMGMIMCQNQDSRAQEYFALARKLAEKQRFNRDFKTREIVSDYFEQFLSYYYRYQTRRDVQEVLHIFQLCLIGQSYREPRPSRMRYAMGMLCKELNHYEEALKYFEQSLLENSVIYRPLHPNIALIHTRIAQIYSSQNKNDQVVENLYKAQEILDQISLLQDPLFHGPIEDAKPEDIALLLSMMRFYQRFFKPNQDLSEVSPDSPYKLYLEEESSSD